MFFMTADYPFGLELQRDTSATVKANSGTVVGFVRHPHEETEFARQARASGADVLELASGHSALIGALRAETEAGIDKRVMIAGLLVFIDDVHELGPELGQGLFHVDSWFWTRDAETRAWSERFFAKHDRMPSSLHAADYSAAYQYLKAVRAIKSDDGDRVLAKLRATNLDDMYLKNGHIRGDGQLTHDMYLLQVKAPAMGSEPWEYDTLVGTFDGNQAWGSKAASRCAAWTSSPR